MCRSVDENRMISDSTYLAAQVRLPNGERMIDTLIAYANVVRAARKAKFPASCIERLEEDFIEVLEDFNRQTDWYRSPPGG